MFWQGLATCLFFWTEASAPPSTPRHQWCHTITSAAFADGTDTMTPLQVHQLQMGLTPFPASPAGPGVCRHASGEDAQHAGRHAAGQAAPGRRHRGNAQGRWTRKGSFLEGHLQEGEGAEWGKGPHSACGGSFIGRPWQEAHLPVISLNAASHTCRPAGAAGPVSDPSDAHRPRGRAQRESKRTREAVRSLHGGCGARARGRGRVA